MYGSSAYGHTAYSSTAGTPIVAPATYSYQGIAPENVGINEVGKSEYLFSGSVAIATGYPFEDKIIIVHDYNSKIVEVS